MIYSRLRQKLASVVILNDLDSIKKFYTRKEFLNRSRFWVMQSNRFQGLGTMNGDTWKLNRRFCMHTLRDFGMGKSYAMKDIVEEFQWACSQIAKAEGEPVAFYDYIVACAYNNILAIVFGRRFPYDHPARADINRLALIDLHANDERARYVDAAEYQQNAFAAVVIEASTGATRTAASVKSIGAEQAEQVAIALAIIDPDCHTVLSDSRQAVRNFAKGQVQREIDEVIGRDRRPTWEDRLRMPFTMASVWEMDRWKTSTPLGVPREASEDAVVDDFFIPKGTVIMANFWAAHFDPKVWRDPHKFDPTRFLNEDGTLMARKPECLLPFSVGQRSCPGETLATVETFLGVTSLLQRFRVLPAGKMPFDINSPP
ncbi:hypothetical protein HPB52_008563 [Rhipicephalus sanguineus]|uniref:Cytochrome P450 n=1 Tax=Rhipicephalus sanguineus TaxID=34632 RepID=A0A9D4T5K5_RHISA|nr:hypothetical protein HPB52_008563 [Rhipicephalus sanguineus]